MAKAKAKPAKWRPKSQPEKFAEAAHMLEADHDEAAFEKRLKKITKAEPKPKRILKKTQKQPGRR
jgi:hypothetical protein